MSFCGVFIRNIINSNHNNINSNRENSSSKSVYSLTIERLCKLSYFANDIFVNHTDDNNTNYSLPKSQFSNVKFKNFNNIIITLDPTKYDIKTIVDKNNKPLYSRTITTIYNGKKTTSIYKLVAITDNTTKYNKRFSGLKGEYNYETYKFKTTLKSIIINRIHSLIVTYVNY